MADDQQESRELYIAAIGPEKARYYLPKFERFAAGGGLISWNWPAFFVSFFWLLYRKMWLLAVFYWFLPIPVFMLLFLVSMFTSFWVYAAAAIIYWLAIFVVLPLYADALYWRHVKKQVELTRRSMASSASAIGYLSATGGTSGAAIGIIIGVMALFLLPVLGILAAIAIPAYQDYVVRAQVAAARMQVAAAQSALVEYVEVTGQLPATLETLDVVSGLGAGEWSAELDYDPADGSLLIAFETGGLAGKTLYLTPYLAEDDSVQWECGSADIDDSQLPQDCRDAAGN